MKKFLSLFSSLILVFSIISLVNVVWGEEGKYKNGDIILFGSYPQSQVKDEATIASLNALVVEWDNWISYGYYSGNGEIGSMIPGDWMRYIDIEYHGEKYRAVRFEKYRPDYTYLEFSEYSNQRDNGYITNNTYWFKFENIKWQILDIRTGLVMCKDIIDSQPYSNTIYYYNEKMDDWTYSWFNDVDKRNFASDYETSSIRKWLNNDFYNVAFTDEEKQYISITDLNNDCVYTLDGITGYEELNSKPTDDKIFLLSFLEVKNEDYGFVPDRLDYSDENRWAKGSDYAKSQGLLEYNYSANSQYIGNSEWFLRTPGGGSGSCCFVYSDGSFGSGNNNVYESSVGIRPSMKINSINEIPQETTATVTQPSITESTTIPTVTDHTTTTCVAESTTTPSVTEPTTVPSTTQSAESSDDNENNCSCICHKKGCLMNFIWKIVRFFWKLFKINSVCGCGIAHY